MVTLQKIAELAHVSKCAASYAFSDKPEKRGKLSEGTLLRILSIAREYHYRPSVSGRGLALSRSFSLGLLLPKKNVQSFSPHFMGMFHGVADAISGSDYNLPLFFGWNEKLEDNLEQHRLDGLLVVARLKESPVFEKLNRLDIPVLWLNRSGCGGDCFSVRTDLAGWAREWLADFAGRGYRRVFLFTRDPRLLAMDVALAAQFPELCREFGLGHEEYLVDDFDGSAPDDTACLFRGENEMLRKWFAVPGNERRSAVFCSPETCKERGYPLLCCGYHDSHKLGEVGAHTLIRAVEKESVPKDFLLPYQKAVQYHPRKNHILEDF